MKLKSIYDILQEKINIFPIYKINNISFTIYPIEYSNDVFGYKENIKFQLEVSKRIIDISKKDIIKATNKMKKFLITYFNNIISYEEKWDRDEIIFNIECYGTKDE